MPGVTGSLGVLSHRSPRGLLATITPAYSLSVRTKAELRTLRRDRGEAVGFGLDEVLSLLGFAVMITTTTLVIVAIGVVAGLWHSMPFPEFPFVF